MDEQVKLVERVDLGVIAGIYVTPDPVRGSGIRMWCGYCCQVLHVDHSHMGREPFLSLMVKMADAHRETECPNPQGPLNSAWNPMNSLEWDQMIQKAHDERRDAEQSMQEALGEMIPAAGVVL